MIEKYVYISGCKTHFEQLPVEKEYVTLSGEQFLKISNYHHMPPFLMTLVSASNHWMFISSNGGLTAGRKDPENALFPYYTDDKIYDSSEFTGSKTILLLEKDDSLLLWEPFSDRYSALYDIRRNVYKSVYGNKLIFEEINDNLGLLFRYSWSTSDKFGFVRRSGLENLNKKSIRIRVLDGIRNILPPGVDRGMQNNFSTLVDAYKRAELVPDLNLALFYLSSIPVDRAEPSEALRATTVWSEGLESPQCLLSSSQLEKFRHGEIPGQETEVRAQKGAFFIHSNVDLTPESYKDWNIVADIGLDSSEIIALSALLEQKKELRRILDEDVQKGTSHLIKLVAASDGLQSSNDELRSSRHFSNVLFNIMRGGIFIDNYTIEKNDFLDFVHEANRTIYPLLVEKLHPLAEKVNYHKLLSTARASGDPNFTRLVYEYLPLYFGRRHGDPSRPWNTFSIDIKQADGSKKLHYQGNWRDIFQNWEALGYSFPGFIESMICKFINAITADGYNPYRVTRDGFEWETLDPDDPWSNIGYWGDHQVIYLLKLLEMSVRFHPGILQNLLSENIFAYAHLPYKLVPYSNLIQDPHHSIEFDRELDQQLKSAAREKGSDGRLIWIDDRIYHVNLAEKLLVILLSKLSNFIPHAGIWMNTQRPEWNDANNALVGYGVSMVTLYYLRRYVAFLIQLLSSLKIQSIDLSKNVIDYFSDVQDTILHAGNQKTESLNDVERRKILDQLGQAGGDYRSKIYQQGFSGQKRKLDLSELIDFFKQVSSQVDGTIQMNKRLDHLYHSYNLMTTKEGGELSIDYLYEMLEGQVAVLSSGFLSLDESVEVLDALRKSALYRADQNSYILYPDRQLPWFLQKNRIPAQYITRSKLLSTLVAEGNHDIVISNENGGFHFNPDFRNAGMLKHALQRLAKDKYKNLVEKEMTSVLDIYEQIFQHRSFTGRSGTFFKYEGLGSIYWHMVSKLLLAVQEVIRSADKETNPELFKRLVKHYHEIKDGIGVHKSPQDYGGFPTDPYSHTPAHAGAQQPGLTGQVKEDIIVRFFELGINIQNGELAFRPFLLDRDEFLSIPRQWFYYDIRNRLVKLDLEKHSFAFTYCQVPIIYRLSTQNRIRIWFENGSEDEIKGLNLGYDNSQNLFNRNGGIIKIDVQLNLTEKESESSYYQNNKDNY